ncbi:acyl-CoA synthetase [Thalassolituus sp. LLYu03]|uniref:acyl-CoA synthetase n=1 Tax=Thalassolituus sp. LLYu03 TaxID=3421656 RepID=UPI003D2D02B6
MSIKEMGAIGEGIASYQDVLNAEQHTPLPQAKSTYELLQTAADKFGDKPALSFFLQTASHRMPEVYSYRALLQKIHRTANFFHQLGAGKDTVIAYILPNLPETHFVIWGGQASGIVAAINPLLEADAMVELLNAAGASILVTLAPFTGTDLWPKVQSTLAHIPTLKHLVLVNIVNHVTGLKGIAAKVLQKKAIWNQYGVHGVKKAVPDSVQVHDFNRAIRTQNPDTLLSNRQFDPQDYSSFFCTGGTTGTPKIAMRRHGNEVANTWSVGQLMGANIGPGKNIFCGLPLFHVNAVQVTGLLPFSRGAHVILGTPQGYRGEGVVSRFWEIVEHHKVNFFSGVPTLYASLLEYPLGQHDIRSLEYGLCGAAPLPVEVFRNFQQRTGLKILEGYGLTEGTCVSSVNPPLGERRLGSIGLRIPGQQMKAVELDESGAYMRDCAANETGVLVIAGPNVFAGYRIDSQNTGLWIDCGDGLRWLNTGDLGYQDNDGYFWLTGRKKELIIRGGHNIDPAAIEEPLHKHPAVQLIAAIGRPDAHAGEVPVAYVQLKPGSSVSEEELLAFAREHISERAAIPKRIYLIDAIPLTPIGKIFKPALKKQEIRSALIDALQDAGITCEDVLVQDDKHKGLSLDVRLPTSEAQQQATAAQVLGQFPFGFRLTSAEEDLNEPA